MFLNEKLKSHLHSWSSFLQNLQNITLNYIDKIHPNLLLDRSHKPGSTLKSGVYFNMSMDQDQVL